MKRASKEWRFKRSDVIAFAVFIIASCASLGVFYRWYGTEPLEEQVRPLLGKSRAEVVAVLGKPQMKLPRTEVEQEEGGRLAGMGRPRSRVFYSYVETYRGSNGRSLMLLYYDKTDTLIYYTVSMG